MAEKKQRKTPEEVLEIVSKLRPIDDVFFQKMVEDPKVCEEILQIILEKPDLRVKPESVVAQKEIHFVANRSIRVDAYAEGQEDIVYNIEIQRANNDIHPKRVRYNASAITVSRSEKGDHFEHVQELYVIYISEFDVLNNGRMISHAEMTCRETGEPVSDGLHVIYVNTAYKEDNRISRFMQEFLNPNMNNSEFPNTSRRVQEIKNNPEEASEVCGIVEEYGKSERKKGRTQLIENMLRNGESPEKIATMCNLPLEEVKAVEAAMQAFV